MRVSLLSLRRYLFTAMISVGFASCSDDVTNPKVISVNDLKTPGTLRLTDDGLGNVTLSWVGNNAEKKFQGYNIYGARGTAEELGLIEGEPVQLTNQAGEPTSDAAELVARFDFDAGTNPERALPGAPTRTVETPEKKNDEETPKFSFLPIHAVDEEGQPILPTCQPSANGGSCVALEKASQKKDAADITASGHHSFEVKGLVPGQSYCFFIFSIQDDGAGISQTSSAPQCIIPKMAAQLSINIPSGTNDRYRYLDIKGLRENCAENLDTGCSELETNVTSEPVNATNSEYALYVESYGTSSPIYLVPGKESLLRQVGRRSGFNDIGIPRDLPLASHADQGQFSPGGHFGSPLRSLPIYGHQMFILAEQVEGEDDSFYYHWVHVAQESDPVRGTAFTLDFRISLVPNVLKP